MPLVALAVLPWLPLCARCPGCKVLAEALVPSADTTSYWCALLLAMLLDSPDSKLCRLMM